MEFSANHYIDKDYEFLIEHLNKISEEGYRNFQQKLVPNINNIIGVRMPILKTIAKSIAKGDWQGYINIVKSKCKSYTYEEAMLHGLTIGYIKSDIDVIFDLLKDFIPCIDNWAVCDWTCSGFKIAKNYMNEFYLFISDYLKSNNEYELRFAIVMLLTYYTNIEYIEKLFEIYESINHEGYYVKMAVAWAIAECFAKHKNETMKFLNKTNIDRLTYNKALQKITESTRIDSETKLCIKAMKRA